MYSAALVIQTSLEIWSYLLIEVVLEGNEKQVAFSCRLQEKPEI